MKSNSKTVQVGIRTLVVLGVLLLASFPVWGQESFGNLSGTVTDPTGAVVPDVAITVTNTATHRVFNTRTGSDGTYRAQDLDPGRYSVAFEKTGFSRHEVPDVILLVGRTLKVDAPLQVGSVTQTVQVTEAPPLIDTGSTMVAHNVTSEEFSRLPKPRNFDGLSIFSTSVNTGEIEGGYQINGASGAENNYYIDGISTTSVLDGRLRQTANLDHLAEVQVKTAGLEAEYGGALGGVVTAITKSGGNEFHGGVQYLYYGNGISVSPTERMQINPDDQYTPQPTFAYFQDQKNKRDFHEIGGSLGGPFIKDKLYFFTSASPRWHRADYQYEFSDGPGTMKRKAHAMSWFNKLDFIPSSRVRTNFTWLYTPQYVTGSLYSYDEFAPNATTATLEDAARVRDRGYYQPEQSFTGTIDFTLSTRSLLSVRGGRYYLNYKEVAAPATHEYWWYGDSTGIPGIDPALEHPPGYTTPASGNVEHDITTRTYVQADFSQYLNAGGQHNIKAGIGTTKNVNNVNDLWFGPDGRVDLYWGATSYRGYPAGQYGFYRVEDGRTSGAAGANITHLYIQDAWRVHPRLTLNLGIRAEKETIPSFQRDIQEYAFKYGFGDKVSPRLGASLDLFGNGKVKISGFWGRFFDWTKFELSRGTFGGEIWRIYYRTLDTLDVYSFDLNNMPGTDIWNGLYGEPFRDLRVPGFDLLDPNVKPMSSDLMNFGVEYEIQPQTVFSARYVRSKLNRTIEDMGVLVEGSEVYQYGNPGEGRYEFEPASGATCVKETDGICYVPVPKAQRTYDALELQVTRRFSRGWLANVSYVYSRLYGNYAGLQSTDEIRPPTLGYSFGASQTFAGDSFRPGGNANRAFDLDEAFYDAHGVNGLLGRLPTDRPHVFKFYGAYDFKFGTQIGTFFRASSGTPVTTQVNTVNHIPMYVDGRGDLGRTPVFSQTDLMVAHEFKFGEVKKLRLEFNMLNLFNQKTSVFTYDRYNQEEAVDLVGIYLGDTDLTQGFDWKAMANAASADAGVGLDPRFGKAAIFNPGFSGRFLIKFIF